MGSKKNQWSMYKSKFMYGIEYNMADKMTNNFSDLNMTFSFINII